MNKKLYSMFCIFLLPIFFASGVNFANTANAGTYATTEDKIVRKELFCNEMYDEMFSPMMDFLNSSDLSNLHYTGNNIVLEKTENNTVEITYREECIDHNMNPYIYQETASYPLPELIKALERYKYDLDNGQWS